MQVRKRGAGIIEQHGPESAHDHVESSGLERAGLRISDDELGVGPLLTAGPVTRNREHGLRQIDARSPLNHWCSCQRRRPAATPDVENPIIAGKVHAFEQCVGEGRKLAADFDTVQIRQSEI
ncbi:MAG: hypothetical protein ABJA33_07640 [Pedococcus sp.]